MVGPSAQSNNSSQFPGYLVLDSIGQGGMGAVYKVEKDNVTYALKTILPDHLDPSALARFEREAVAAAAVDKHPNIVSVHKLELNNQPPFIVMDYIEGKSLSQFIERGESWRLEDVIELLEPLANALDHMHSKGVIHRDLKPANILIRDHDSAPMITDFGLAKETNLETLTQTGEILGTPNYMAPEQFSGQTISPQTDIWALGVIAFNLLSGGKHPFSGESLVQLAHAILRTPAELNQLSPSSKHLTAVLQRALSKSNPERYASCHEFLVALKAPPPTARSWSPKIVVVIFGLVILVALALFLLNNRTKPTKEPNKKKSSESLRLSWEQLKADIDVAQDEFPKHYFLHLNSEFPKVTPLSKATQRDCEKFSTLRKRVDQFEQDIHGSQINHKKLRKQLSRWRELSESYTLLEKTPEDYKIEKVTAELEVGKFLQAYFKLKGAPEQSAQILDLAPENKNWRAAWLLMRAICAKKTKKNARALKYLTLLQKENPNLFNQALQKELWKSKILVIEGRGKLKPQERFQVIFYHWRIKTLDPDFKIPEAYQEAFTPQGQLNIQYLNKKISNLIAKGPQQIFEITLDAADHGVYLDHLDDNQSRQMLHSQGIAEENFKKRPQHGPSVFWRAYAQRPYSILNGAPVPLPNILRDIESALKFELPSFQRAQLLAHRALITQEHRRNNADKYDIDKVKESCLRDIDDALRLTHPRPHHLFQQKYELLFQYYEAKNQLKDKKSELFDLLDQYLASCQKLFKLSTENEGRDLIIGRPPGVPYGRFNDNDLNLYDAEVAHLKAKFYMSLKNWASAEIFNSKAFAGLKDFSSASDRLIILKTQNKVKEIKELQKNLIEVSNNNPEKQRSFKKLIQDIDLVIEELERK